MRWVMRWRSWGISVTCMRPPCGPRTLHAFFLDVLPREPLILQLLSPTHSMKMLLARACLIGLVMIVAVQLYGDPYTLYMTSDAPFIPAPAARTLVILLEFGLFACYSYFVWNKRDAAAIVAISLATIIDLCLNIVLVRIHGVDHNCPVISSRTKTGCMLIPATFRTLQRKGLVKPRFFRRG